MRKCLVCRHPEREAIEQAITSEKTLREIAICYDMSYGSLHRHKRNHLPVGLTAIRHAHRTGNLRASLASRRAAALGHGRDLLTALEASIARLDKLVDTCDALLADPDRPGHYDLTPRSDEVMVRYPYIDGGGKCRRSTAPLAAVLEPGFVPGACYARPADPRQLLLKTLARLEVELELLARFESELASAALGPSVDDLATHPDWVRSRGILLAALEAHPAARIAVIDGLAGCGAATESDVRAALANQPHAVPIDTRP